MEIREYLNTVPVIETHEHYTGKICPVKNVLSFIVNGYLTSDFLSAAHGMEKDIEKINDESISFDERYSIFERVYNKTSKTAYALGVKTGLKECWSMEKIDRNSIMELEEKFKGRDQKFYKKTMDTYGIKAKVVDLFAETHLSKIAKDYSKLCRFAFPLPQYHSIHNSNDIKRLEKFISRKITCLDDYTEAFEIYLKECIEFGIVCIKDQSAYRRVINYSYPSRMDSEKIFNEIISKPRNIFGDNETRVLDDWLFHYFMKLAGKYDLPVQLHTGHMAGIRNDIAKTNAVHLTSILELYSDVRFDLFHGNWPYMGEFLFLGKNYPNVWLDLCWVQQIDPLYSIELMKRALVTVPHTKVMAFGGDTGQPEWVAGYLVMARDNVAFALSDMVDCGWIDMREAKEIAADWFFNNPNEFFKLGFDPFKPEIAG